MKMPPLMWLAVAVLALGCGGAWYLLNEQAVREHTQAASLLDMCRDYTTLFGQPPMSLQDLASSAAITNPSGAWQMESYLSKVDAQLTCTKTELFVECRLHYSAWPGRTYTRRYGGLARSPER